MGPPQLAEGARRGRSPSVDPAFDDGPCPDRTSGQGSHGLRKVTVAATPRLDGVDRSGGTRRDLGDADEVRGLGGARLIRGWHLAQAPPFLGPPGTAGRAKPCASKSVSNAKAVTIPSRRMTSKLTWSTSECDELAARWAANAARWRGSSTQIVVKAGKMLSVSWTTAPRPSRRRARARHSTST